SLSGDGIVALESPVPREELVEFNLVDDVVKIDGNMAIAWSSTLNFTVEKSTKSLIGSGISGEGFVNVYRGTGKILMAPTIPGTTDVNLNGPEASVSRKSSSAGVISSVGSSLFG
ncbi:MAG: AIM24 family protein, partial [Lachnospiraceae bacterium]|nr:AIM24 family protein [Lachnospiraceae bacterium]